MIHWIESEDDLGFPIWLRYVECGHWGLVLTAKLPRWLYYPWRGNPAAVKDRGARELPAGWTEAEIKILHDYYSELEKTALRDSIENSGEE